MGLLSFIKEAGEKLFGGSSAQAATPDANTAAAAAIKTYIETQNLGLTGLEVTYTASSGVVTLAGQAPSQEASEKASLAAGNACVVKPAEDASLSLLRLAEIATEVGFPAGALNVVTGYGKEAGAALCAHPGIDHISFTGSTMTGRSVGLAAAERHCPVTLELGGKSPQIVFADADLDAAEPVLVNAIIQNAGQTCSAGSRVLVEQDRKSVV